MPRTLAATLLLVALAAPAGRLALAKPSYVEPSKPFSKLVKAKSRAFSGKTPIPVPLITWGGDVATVLANGGRETAAGSIFAAEGLKLALNREDDFVKQVESYLSGETPYLRGTLGMINMASEALSADAGARPVAVYQMTWSTGGDALVVRGDIKKASDLKGKTIALQQYGPHVDYMDTILRDAGISWSEVGVRWLKELTLPGYDTAGSAVDPASAFREDKTIDAAFVIIPDALALTSGGTVGTGAEDSVKGARILLSTKTASRVIADIYAVRKDYLEKNRGDVEKFVRGLLKAQEKLADLVKRKSSNQTEYQQMLGNAADLLFDTPQATSDVEGLIADCTFVGASGNVSFFADPKELRSFSKLTETIQKSLVEQKFLTAAKGLDSAGWDWASLMGGTAVAPKKEEKRFDTQKVEKKLAQQAPGATPSEALFSFEIYFKPNQDDFSAAEYKKDFDRALELSRTYAGAILQIVGHTDPMKYLRARKDGQPEATVMQLAQSAKNLSLARANSVRKSLIEYAQGQAVSVDSSQFVVTGAGVDQPKHSSPASEAEWRDNMRVVFQLINVEAELESFAPLN
ncbi:MAG: ABC transporter substrate-binding protein [Candidatus Schekmanbacteria bacterium]|nr:ABC transporter substrate-binding protein [Candidatus Schekmanbacteria bacterium]